MTTQAAAPATAAADHPARSVLMLGALGVVFGDIGTSPIYALREALKAAGGTAAEPVVLGVLSLVFWAVVLVVAVKYVVFVMRADNHGEGGTMALLSLAVPVSGRAAAAVLAVGLTGAALFFGDAMITPAISVLSAVEGLALAVPGVTPYVLPIACAVLVGLFAIQSRGSGQVGKLFGPVMVAWFVLLGLAGLVHVAGRPDVLRALDPRHAIGYLGHAPGWVAFSVLGSAFLALTGGEALYADMGHFGRSPIRLDWFAVVMPALVLNYLGQGALVLNEPQAVSNPFFLLFPGWLLVPVVALATMATVIASQAVISGAFALVQQAIQLGALPRLEVRQTSDASIGQVYVPQVNWLLAAAVLGLVLGFRSSDALANAYGIAVAGDMLVTTVLVAIVARGVWAWPLSLVVPVACLFLALDVTFVSANLHKIPRGGWFPLLVATLVLLLVFCWRRGRAAALARREEDTQRLDRFLAGLDGEGAPIRVPGLAVYLTTRRDVVPDALALNLRHNGVLHERVLLLKVTTDRVPRLDDAARVAAEDLSGGVSLAELHFGFAEKPDVPAALAAHMASTGCDPGRASFFIGRENPVPSLHPAVPRWQEKVYAFLTRNAVSAPDYFLIPPPQVIELGTKIEL